MEKVISVEDKIKRAEEIYYKRKNQDNLSREDFRQLPREKKNIKLFKKMIKQIVICLLIYSVSYLISNGNYIFSEDFSQKIKEILAQDINFIQIYNDFYNMIKQNNEESENIEQIENKEETDAKIEEEEIEEKKTEEELQTNDENIGGAEELPITLSQMEQDANYIKNTVDFKKPLEGTISSMFGVRNPTTETVPKNHTGTDIAAAIGTKIVSATDGIVIYTSSKGDYGNHIKIQIDDVIVLYAHCNKLYVKEGDIIKQGQEIGEVGITGNTTGPHLHFEIRYQDRYVNPQLIVEL